MLLLTYLSSSAVFGVFLAIGTFIFAIIRAYFKPLIFMSIFGTIAMDIFCVRCVPPVYHRLLIIRRLLALFSPLPNITCLIVYSSLFQYTRQ
jgi:hypothetical protein